MKVLLSFIASLILLITTGCVVHEVRPHHRNDNPPPAKPWIHHSGPKPKPAPMPAKHDFKPAPKPSKPTPSVKPAPKTSNPPRAMPER